MSEWGVKSYENLERVLSSAYSQAARGKGKERHAEEDEPFEKQQICEIGRRLQGNPSAGPLFQAVKKIYESGRLPKERAIAELYGAINYIAAGIIIQEERDIQTAAPVTEERGKFYDLRMCEASILHITKNDEKLLDLVVAQMPSETLCPPLSVYQHTHGWFVFLDDRLLEAFFNGFSLEFSDFGFSKYFFKLMLAAKLEGFHWMKIDASAPQTQGFCVFERD